jgi:hypothetical protein
MRSLHSIRDFSVTECPLQQDPRFQSVQGFLRSYLRNGTTLRIDSRSISPAIRV